MLRISLDQWAAFVAVVEEGGFSQAAARLSKSQSTISYAIQQIAQLLDVEILRTEGRRSVVTPTGEALYRRARYLLEEASALEKASRTSGSWESVVRVAVEVAYPLPALLRALDVFSTETPNTLIEVSEFVLGHRTHAMSSGEFDLAIFNSPPDGFMGERLLTVDFVLVAHRDHALHKLKQPLTMRDLRHHRHVLLRESSEDRGQPPTVQSTQRWTFGQLESSIQAVRAGYAYTWLPEPTIRQDLASGLLVPLPARDGNRRTVDQYMVFADREKAGPATTRLAELLKLHASEWLSA